MRFTNLIAAVVAMLLPLTTFAAPVETQIHLHMRCERWQEWFKKCIDIREIVECRWFNGNWYWMRDRTCPTGSICTETTPYEPYCEPLIWDCAPICKMVNGTVTDLDGNPAQLIASAEGSAKGVEGLVDVEDSKQDLKDEVLPDDSPADDTVTDDTPTDDAPLESTAPEDESLNADALLNSDGSSENSVTAVDSVQLETRSERPCRSWEWGLRKCIEVTSIFICEERANGYYWTLSERCLVGQRCTEAGPYQPFCQGYVFDCTPLCKIVNGTVVDTHGNKANLIDPPKENSDETN